MSGEAIDDTAEVRALPPPIAALSLYDSRWGVPVLQASTTPSSPPNESVSPVAL